MSDFPFEVILFVGSEEHSRSFSPSLGTARKVAKWHCDKAGINRATLREVATGTCETFGADGDDVHSHTSGEILDECPGCLEKEIVIAELMKQLKGEKLKYAALYREKEEEAEDSPEWDDVRALFDFWRRVCKHERSKLDLARYRNVIGILKSDGKELCARAIAGAAFESFSSTRKSGAKIVYNDWEFIFRNRTNFEKECNRAPNDWKTIYQWEEPQP